MSESSPAAGRAPQSILVLGAGYAGLALTRKLDWWLGKRSKHQVILVDRRDQHELVVRLHEVAAASIPPEDATVPITHVLRGRRIRFQRAQVTGFDVAGRFVRTSEGNLPFDLLVVALGGETEYFNLPGVRQYSLPLRTLADALRLRRHTEGQVVRARHDMDPGRRAARLTFVVGGGGFTGTELAGELLDRLAELTALHEIGTPARVVLLEARDHLLPGFPTSAAERAAGILGSRGVEVRLECPVASAGPGFVRLESGEEIATETFVWAGGVRANRLVAESGLPIGKDSRAQVDACLQWAGLEGVFVVGDSSGVIDPGTQRPAAPSAQMAIQQAEHLAHNLYRLLEGRPMMPFRPLPLIEVVSLGRREAIAGAGTISLSGPEARALKALSYWRYQRAL